MPCPRSLIPCRRKQWACCPGSLPAVQGFRNPLRWHLRKAPKVAAALEASRHLNLSFAVAHEIGALRPHFKMIRTLRCKRPRPHSHRRSQRLQPPFQTNLARGQKRTTTAAKNKDGHHSMSASTGIEAPQSGLPKSASAAVERTSAISIRNLTRLASTTSVTSTG